MERMPVSRVGAIVLLFASLVSTAYAQDPGEQPVAAAGAGVSTLPAPQPPSEEGAVQSAVTSPVDSKSQEVSAKRPPRLKSSAPPREISVASGQNTVFSVALFHVNRIVTPFRDPQIRTSSTATMSVENGIVYVTTQTDDPIGLFVFEKSQPEQAISLTLNPAAISPVSVKINLQGWSAANTSYAISGDEKKARSWETTSPYIETVKTLFKDLASNKIPDGFGLSALQGRYAFMPQCSMYGVSIVPLQLVEGSEITAIIARVTNVSYQPVEVNESKCKSSRLIGAASWPKYTLNPGESTELYIAIQSPRAEDFSTERPSVIGRGR